MLFRLKQLLEEHFEELAALVTRENGKTLAEARGEVRRGIEVVEFACGVPTLLMGTALEDIARGIDCETVRHPVGVVRRRSRRSTSRRWSRSGCSRSRSPAATRSS